MKLMQDIVSSAIKHPIFFTVMTIIFLVFAYLFWKPILAFVFLILAIVTAMFAIIGIRKTATPISQTMKTILMIVIPVFMILSLIGVYGIFGILGEIDTDTPYKKYSETGLWGHIDVRLTGGNEYDPVDMNEDELLDQSKYVTAWKEGRVSEKIVVAGRTFGRFIPTSVQLCMVDKYWIDVYLDDSADWSNPDYVSTPDNPYSDKITWNTPDGANPGEVKVGSEIPMSWANIKLGPQIFHINGPYVGYLKVIIHVRYSIRNILGWELAYFVWNTTDHAYLLSGAGNVVVKYPNGYDEVQEGETVEFHVDTGFSGPAVAERDKGWLLTLYYPYDYPDKGGKPFMNWTIPDNRHPYVVKWTVPQGIWKPHVSNAFRLILCNQLINQNESYVLIIDFREKMPPAPRIEVENNWMYPNERMNVTIYADKSELTGLNISEIRYCAFYGELADNNWIIPWTIAYNMQPLNGNTWVATFVLSPPYPGDVSILAQSMDTEGRQSDMGRAYINVMKPGETVQKASPGQYVSISLDTTFTVNVAELEPRPEKVMYYIYNTNNKLVYKLEKKPSFVQKTYDGLLEDEYHVMDTASFQVPAFPKEGVWTIRYEIVDERLGLVNQVIDKGLLSSFEVVSGSLFQNLFAPKYFHLDLWVKDWWIKIPAFWAIVIIIVVIIVGILLYKFYFAGKISVSLKRIERKVSR